MGPGSGTSGPSQSSSLAAAAIEAATFAQQVNDLNFEFLLSIHISISSTVVLNLLLFPFGPFKLLQYPTAPYFATQLNALLMSSLMVMRVAMILLCLKFI